MALLGASRTSPYGHDTFTEIIATKGKLTVGNPPLKNRVQISDKHGVRNECNETFFDRFKDAFLIQIQDFVNCVLEGKQPECTLENATKATIVTNAMTKSFKTKGIVELDIIKQTAMLLVFRCRFPHIYFIYLIMIFNQSLLFSHTLRPMRVFQLTPSPEPQ